MNTNNPVSYYEYLVKSAEFSETLVNMLEKLTIWDITDMIFNFLKNCGYPPAQMAITDTIKHVETTKAHLTNGKAYAPDKEMAFVGSIPKVVMTILTYVYGDKFPLTEKKFTSGFFKRYPAFKVTSLNN